MRTETRINPIPHTIARVTVTAASERETRMSAHYLRAIEAVAVQS